jgi:hypothetical protein
VIEEFHDHDLMVPADFVQGGGYLPGIKHAVEFVLHSGDSPLVERHFPGPGLPLAVVGGDGEIARDGMQPRTGSFRYQLRRVLPRSQHRLLYDVLRGLAVAVDERQNEAKERLTVVGYPRRLVVALRSPHVGSTRKSAAAFSQSSRFAAGSVRISPDLVSAGADEEVEVGAAVSLQDVVDVEALPAALRMCVPPV